MREGKEEMVEVVGGMEKKVVGERKELKVKEGLFEDRMVIGEEVWGGERGEGEGGGFDQSVD